MRRIRIGIVMLMVLLFAVGSAYAGNNWVIIATDGEGTPVYASATSKRQIGTLYNGFSDSIDLFDTNGLYGCRLTTDTKGWINQEKAEKYLPEGVYSYSYPDAENVPCNCFLAEVTVDNAKLYSGTGHKHVLAEHRAGTLVMVCGSFGDDYFVMYAGTGFMSKKALHKVCDLAFEQVNRGRFGMEEQETATVYLEQGKLQLNASATGVSEERTDISVENGDEVSILRDLGDWVQVAVKTNYGWDNGGFIEKRYLDPNGDHSVQTAVIKTDHPLNRLNLRYSADKESNSQLKLCSGLRVQTFSSANGWTEIAVYAEKGSWSETGFVKSVYLATGEEADEVPDACVRVRLLRDYQSSKYADIIPAGTEGTVIGVEETNRFVVRLDTGAIQTFRDEDVDPLLDPIEPPVWEARTTKQIALREGPNSESKKIRALKSGTTVEVLLRGEKWVLVRVNGETGYVLNNAIKPKKIK